MYLSTTAGPGGELGKQGYLRAMSKGVGRRRQPGKNPWLNPLVFKARHGAKWFVCRESFMLAVEDADDVRRFFLLLPPT